MSRFLRGLCRLSLLLACMLPINAAAKGFADETLHYVVSYKWGLIHKDAGEATLSLRSVGSNYDITLAARTKPWVEKFYTLRDTLLGTMRKSDLRPLSYTNIVHENKRVARDAIKYKYSGNNVTGICHKFRRNKKGAEWEEKKTMSATGPVYDMLSVFYFLRTINYANLTKGKVMKASVFSGSGVETITIRSIGVETIKMRDKSTREAYHLKFNFTTDGKKKSSDDIDTWISTDSRHIPLYLVGQLPVGKVQAYYVQ